MVVRYSHVTEDKAGSVYRAEYTVNCGWIDWSHATPNREDVEKIWASLPPQNGKNKPDVRIRNKSTKKEHEYWEVSVPHLDGDSVSWTATWYVRHDGFNESKFYKQAALTLYEKSCEWVESQQDDRWKDIAGQSGWSMEDLVSNLMAFYGHVEGLNRKSIIAECGGWTAPNKAAEMSKKVYDELDDNEIVLDPFHPGFTQPSSKGRSFREAYLYNKDLSASITKDNRIGWHDVPKFFRSIEPLVAFGDYAGSDILSQYGLIMLFATHDVRMAANSSQSNHLRQQQLAYGESTKRGRMPGPAGLHQA